MRAVRTSERRCFKRCRTRWGYEYLERLKPIARNSKLWVGEAVHIGLAAFHKWGDDVAMQTLMGHFTSEHTRLGYNQMDEEERGRLDEDVDLAQGMVEHYCRWAPQHQEFRTIDTEIYAEIPLSKDVVITLRADGLVEDDDGLWLLEHKTTNNIDGDAFWLEIDDQATTYTWAFEQLHKGVGEWRSPSGELIPASESPGGLGLVRGILYNFLLKQVPHEVILNKDDSVSRGSPNLKCTVEDYEKALLGAPKHDPEVYEDFLTKLRAKKWFHRLRVYRGRAELEGFEQHVTAETAEMWRAEQNELIRYRNPNRDCNWDCSYFDICKGELEGLDMDVIREEKFAVEEQMPLPEA